MNTSKYDLYHFHIEASENDIQWNKFETNPKAESSFFTDRSLNLSLNKKFRSGNKKNKRNISNVEIPSDYLDQEVSFDLRVPAPIVRKETEEYISNELLKMSPTVRGPHRKSTIKAE